jgi:hypothetical protein
MLQQVTRALPHRTRHELVWVAEAQRDLLGRGLGQAPQAARDLLACEMGGDAQQAPTQTGCELRRGAVRRGAARRGAQHQQIGGVCVQARACAAAAGAAAQLETRVGAQRTQTDVPPRTGRGKRVPMLPPGAWQR